MIIVAFNISTIGKILNIIDLCLLILTSSRLITWQKTTTTKQRLCFQVGPGLAQLVERLAHRYSENTSLNPGNLTSATVCGDRTGCTPATKRSVSVAPEVDLGECTLYSPPLKANKAEATLALKPRGDVTRNPKQGYQWPQKRTCVSAKNFSGL